MKCMVGLDTSELGQEVFEVACGFIKQPETDILYIVHVWQPSVEENDFEFDSIMQVNKNLEQQARHHLVKFSEQCDIRNIKHRCLLVSGDPGKELCNLVKKYQIDALVLGSRHLGTIEKFFMGSVSEYCLKHAECSVMIHRKGNRNLLHVPPAPAAQTMTGKEYLSHATISDCMSRHRPLYKIEADASADRLCKILRESSVTSVPVFDKRQAHWLGFLDMTDVARCILDALQPLKADEDIASVLEKRPLAWLQATDLLKQNKATRNQPWESLRCEESLKTAIDLFIDRDLKRIGVSDKNGNIFGILSHLKIVSFIADRATIFEWAHKTVKDLSLGYCEVPVVKDTTKIRFAMEKIVNMNLTGLGVTNDQGKLIGNISAADLRLASSDEELIRLFLLPVKQLLSHQKEKSIPSPICVQSKATIEEVIEKFEITKVHRLYVLSEKEELLGVITPKEIIQLLHSIFIPK